MTHKRSGNELETAITANAAPIKGGGISKEALTMLETAFEARGKIRPQIAQTTGDSDNRDENFDAFKQRMGEEIQRMVDAKNSKELLIREIILNANLKSRLDADYQEGEPYSGLFYEKLTELSSEILTRLSEHIKDSSDKIAIRSLASIGVGEIAQLYYGFDDRQLQMFFTIDESAAEKFLGFDFDTKKNLLEQSKNSTELQNAILDARFEPDGSTGD